MKNQFEFKPFDQVLVRDSEQGIWKAGIFSHYEKESNMPYICIGSFYTQCIPYNEETAHLIGTNKPYKEPEPIAWYVVSRDGLEKYNFTTKEFEQFLTNIVVKNKDVTDFRIRYIPK